MVDYFYFREPVPLVLMLTLILVPQLLLEKPSDVLQAITYLVEPVSLVLEPYNVFLPLFTLFVEQENTSLSLMSQPHVLHTPEH